MISFNNPPEGFGTLTPYLIVKDGDKMIEFYKKAFGAEVVGEVMRVPDTNVVMHATMTIGGSPFMLNDEFPTHGSLSPATTGQTSSSIHIAASSGIDELYDQAIKAGAESVMAPEDMFWGDRFCQVKDPSGHKWSIGQPIENPPKVSEQELREMMGTT